MNSINIEFGLLLKHNADAMEVNSKIWHEKVCKAFKITTSIFIKIIYLIILFNNFRKSGWFFPKLGRWAIWRNEDFRHLWNQFSHKQWTASGCQRRKQKFFRSIEWGNIFCFQFTEFGNIRMLKDHASAWLQVSWWDQEFLHLYSQNSLWTAKYWEKQMFSKKDRSFWKYVESVLNKFVYIYNIHSLYSELKKFLIVTQNSYLS